MDAVLQKLTGYSPSHRVLLDPIVYTGYFMSVMCELRNTYICMIYMIYYSHSACLYQLWPRLGAWYGMLYIDLYPINRHSRVLYMQTNRRNSQGHKQHSYCTPVKAKALSSEGAFSAILQNSESVCVAGKFFIELSASLYTTGVLLLWI